MHQYDTYKKAKATSEEIEQERKEEGKKNGQNGITYVSRAKEAISLPSFVFTGEEISLWLIFLFHLRHGTFMFMKWLVARGTKLRNNANPRE